VSDNTHIPVVGIVGGIGSGKSSLARWVATRHSGVTLIDGDHLGHEVLENPDVQHAIRTRFGDQVFDKQGAVDRKSLGRIVFGPEQEQQRARRDLEQIVHPRIRELIQTRISEAADAGQTVVLVDAAVLFEAGWNDLCDAVVFVEVPREERLKRLSEKRGWDRASVEAREASQATLESKTERAQFVVDNARSIDESGRDLERILTQIGAPTFP
jgi:dephospho-CoA kinase